MFVVAPPDPLDPRGNPCGCDRKLREYARCGCEEILPPTPFLHPRGNPTFIAATLISDSSSAPDIPAVRVANAAKSTSSARRVFRVFPARICSRACRSGKEATAQIPHFPATGDLQVETPRADQRGIENLL